MIISNIYEVVPITNKILFIIFIMMFIPIASATQELVVSAPSIVDSTFKIGLSLNETADFNGAEFSVEGATISAVTFPISSVDAITDFSDGNVLIAVPNVIATKTFAELMLSVTGSASQEKIITITNIKVSVDDENSDSQLITLNDVSTTIKLSECIAYSNSHVSATGLKLFDKDCYCDEGYMPSIDIYSSEPKCVLESETTSIYGNLSTECEEGLDPISNTGYCCIDSYEYAFGSNFADLLGNPEESCIPQTNKLPIARISQPDNNEYIDTGRVYFKSNGTDSDGTIVSYLWDFGDRSQPWGYLEITDDEVICKKTAAKTKCSEDEAISLDDFNEDDDIPCSCEDKYGTDILNIYPNSVSEKQNTVHTYSDKYDCTGYDEDKTIECEITLWVFDNDGGEGKTKIEIELKEDKSSKDDDDNDFYCGDGLVTGTEECDSDAVSECTSGVCESDCTCTVVKKDVVFDDDLDDDDIGTVCGNNRCEFGENAVTCLSDCHCGDGTCQQSLENSDNCSKDCGSGSSGLMFPILIVIILAAAGIIFMLYKKGFDFSSLTSKFSGFGSKKSKGFSGSFGNSSTKTTSNPPLSPTSKLEQYISASRKRGYSYTQIKEELEKKGWHEDQINDTFSRVGMP
jgi:hypothetical protein